MKLPAFSKSDSLPEDRMHWVKVAYSEVEALYQQKPIRMERNYQRRARETSHLRNSNIPLHMNFVAARTPDGQLHLVDGYTRVTTINAGEKPRPEQVWLGVVDVDSVSEIEPLYDACDSRQAVKRGRDAFEEGLRRSGLLNKLQSPAFVRAGAVSAVSAATGKSDVRQSVYELRQGIRVLDGLNVTGGRKGLPAGALAGLLLIATREKDSESVKEFANALLYPEEVPTKDRARLKAALLCAAYLEERRQEGALSGKNISSLLDSVLSHWAMYQQGTASRRLPAVDRDEYLAALGS